MILMALWPPAAAPWPKAEAGLRGGHRAPRASGRAAHPPPQRQRRWAAKAGDQGRPHHQGPLVRCGCRSSQTLGKRHQRRKPPSAQAPRRRLNQTRRLGPPPAPAVVERKDPGGRGARSPRPQLARKGESAVGQPLAQAMSQRSLSWPQPQGVCWLAVASARHNPPAAERQQQQRQQRGRPAAHQQVAEPYRARARSSTSS